MADIDPITLAVVSGALSSAVSEMSVVIERTARSPVLALSHDSSNAVYTTVTRVPELRSMLSMAAALSRAWAGDEEGARELIRTEVPQLNLDTCGGLVVSRHGYP